MVAVEPRHPCAGFEAVYNRGDEMSRARTLAKLRAQSRKQPLTRTLPGTGSLLTGNRRKIVLCVLLATATIALYSPVLGHGFVIWDDDVYVTGNAHVKEGLSWSTIQWAFTSTKTAAYWHPLTWLSHALDYQLFALNPAGHHLDSILIHALNSVVLFLLLAWVTSRVGPSLLVAALFAVHPLNVESVAWVAERKNVLSTLFFLLAIAAYVWYARKPDWRRYMLVAALFAVGLMAKPMVITLPFVLLLLDYWPLERLPAERLPVERLPPEKAQIDLSTIGRSTIGRSTTGLSISQGVPRVAFTRLLLEKVPLLALSAASALITLVTQRVAMPVASKFPLPLRIENAIVSYGEYLWKTFWPARLAALYPYPTSLLPAWQVALSAIVLVGVTVLVLAFRRKGYLPVGWFWFLGTLVPVIGLVQVGGQAMADRFAYVPLIGIFIMIAWGLDDWAKARNVGTVWLVVPALCVLTVLGFAAHRQMSYWESEYDLHSHTLEVTERNYVAHGLAAYALVHPNEPGAMTQGDLERLNTEQGRMEEARWHHQEALKILRDLAQRNPDAYRADMAVALMSWGGVEIRLSQMDQAREHYEEALQIYHELAQQGDPAKYLPDMFTISNYLGNLDLGKNRLDEANEHYEEALHIYRQLAQQDPAKYLDMFTALNYLGNLDVGENRLDQAREHYEEALKIQSQIEQQSPGKSRPAMALALANLGNLDWRQKRMGEARTHYTEALAFYRKLAQEEPAKYASDVAKVEASLKELGTRLPPNGVASSDGER